MRKLFQSVLISVDGVVTNAVAPHRWHLRQAQSRPGHDFAYARIAV
jgi:hypothetical protein